MRKETFNIYLEIKSIPGHIYGNLVCVFLEYFKSSVTALLFSAGKGSVNEAFFKYASYLLNQKMMNYSVQEICGKYFPKLGIGYGKTN